MKNIRYPFLARLAASFVFLVMLCSVTGLIHAQPLALDRRVTEGRLDNGMRYLIRPTFSAGVDVRLVVNTGSLDERDDELGYAHFVEHLAFRKTKRFNDGEIVEFVRSLGGSFGQHLNAFTSHNQTQYWLSVPAGKTNSLLTAVKVVSDWASGIEFTDAIANIERGVVASEKRSRDQSTQPVFKIREALFDQPLYKREIVGTYETIKGATAERLQAFYKRTYTPERMTIVLSGELGEGITYWKRKLNDEFGQTPVSANAEVKPIRPPFRFEDRLRILQLTDGQRSSLSLAVLAPQTIGSSREDLAAAVLRAVSTAVLSQRLAETAKQQRLTLAQAATDFAITPDARGFEISVTVSDKDKFEEGYAALLSAVEKFVAEGPTVQELAAVKRPALRSARTAEEESDKATPPQVGSVLAFYAHSGGYYISAAQYREMLNEIIPTITPKDVAVEIARRFSNNDLLLIVQGEKADPTPKLNEGPLKTKAQQFLATIASAAISTKASNKNSSAEEADKVALSFPAPLPPGSITKEESLSDGITRLTLSNLATVYVKEIKSSVDQVVFSARRKSGSWGVEESLIPISRVAQAGGWFTDGIGPYDQTALGKELAARNLSVRANLGSTDTTAGIRGRSEDLGFGLSLLHEFVRNPKVDVKNFDRYIEQIRPILLGNNLQPEQLFQRDWLKARRGESPWLDSLKPAQLSSVTPDQLKKMQGQFFNDASQMVFAFTGNVSLRDIRRLTETYLANLPSSESKSILPEAWATFNEEKSGVRWETKAGKADRASLTLRYVNASVADNLETGAIAGQMQFILNDRLRLNLRQTSGLTYSPSGSVQLNQAPLKGIVVSVTAQLATADVPTAEAVIRATIQSLIDQPPNAEEMQAYREAYGSVTRNLLADSASAAELLLTLHQRGISIDQLKRTRQAALQQEAATLNTNFKKMLVGVEPSIGLHLPEN
jgi:zinc protease